MNPWSHVSKFKPIKFDYNLTLEKNKRKIFKAVLMMNI